MDGVRPDAEFEAVQQLIRAGLNDCAISRETGIPRGTVRDWRHQADRRERDSRARIRQSAQPSACRPLDCPLCEGGLLERDWYAYLLGLYLGDGSISDAPRRLQAPDRPRYQVPGHHRRVLRSNGADAYGSPCAALRRAEDRLRRGECSLEALAVPLSSTWTWSQARPTDRVAVVAAIHCRGAPRKVAARTDSFGWMSRSESCKGEGLSQVLVHE